MRTNSINFSIIFILIVASGLCSCGNSNPDKVSNYTPGDTTDRSHVSGGIVQTVRGEEIFQQRCSACHGLNGSYRNNNAANLQLTRLDSFGIITTIRNGRGAMPMFSKDALPDSDIAQVELYVKTLRKI